MLPLFIARRHLFSRKAHSVINLIALVSTIAIAVPVMALVAILSFHNGLGTFIEQMYSEFDSDVRVTPTEGTLFNGENLRKRLETLPEVAAVSATLEQTVLLTYSDRQWIATLRGVDEYYDSVIPLPQRLVQGKYRLKQGDQNEAVIGKGIAYALGIQTALIEPLHIYAIRPGHHTVSLFPRTLYRTATVRPVGIYALDEQTDAQYLFVPITLAQELTSAGNRISSLEVRLKNGIAPEKGKQLIQPLAGNTFKVQTRFEQKETIYRMVEQEKWMIYLLLLFVVLIAALSLVGSLVMLAADKEHDRQMLIAMGATTRLLRQLFTWEGSLITACGVLAGILLGVGFALAQQQFGIIKMAGEAFLMEAYPVHIHPTDIVAVAGGVWLMGSAVSALTAAALVNRHRKLT